MAVNDSGNDSGTFVVATNVTVADSSGAELSLFNTSASLNSVIVGGPDPGISVAGDAICGIGFSRGPSISGDPNGCGGFQTTAAPGFADPGTDDYHLAAGSPMIDMGDPAAPLGGALDLDGDPRAADGDGDGTVRRDIGADETATVQPTPPTPANPAAPGAAKKKCKKKRKKKGGAGAAKRKKCKKKRKK